MKHCFEVASNRDSKYMDKEIHVLRRDNYGSVSEKLDDCGRKGLGRAHMVK